MKLKFLLLSIFFAGILNAQVCDYPEGVVTSLVITEINMSGGTNMVYVELTNMGNTPIRLGEFKFGQLPWQVRSSAVNDLCFDPWSTSTHEYLFLPDRILDPGKSFVITTAFDYGPRHYKEGLGRLGGSERPKQPEMYEIADKLYHRQELIDGIYYESDSVTTAQNDPETLKKRNSDYSRVFGSMTGFTFYIEHHYSEGDSAVVDQVGGIFDDAGRNRPQAYDVAGQAGATTSGILVRKSIVKNGNIDFANARGMSIEESEWIPIPVLPGYNAWRDVWWTIGNQGNYILNESTLEPITEAISVDYANKKITVPWGTLRLDEIMSHMKRKPGVAWNYFLNSAPEDSLYRSARTGDQLTIYVVGNSLNTTTFDIEVKQPTADDNIVIPLDRRNSSGSITTRAQNGILSWPRVTRHTAGVDTITGSGFGLAYDLRTDSLLKYLEKPPKATWEFVWVDGQLRPDLKNGDILRVTSESGKVKEYFIQLQTYFPNRNVDLAAITWPDIPDFYRGYLGWTGDTIPNFGSGTTNYRLEVPADVEGIPALKAKTAHVNASVKVTRAKSLTGTIHDRSVNFEVTAEDDTVKRNYSVELVKEKLPHEIEPYFADPIVSKFISGYPTNNSFIQLYNPGNQPLDLRDYLIGLVPHADMYRPITVMGSWLQRYTRYIPGLKHVDEETWTYAPKMLLPDPNVNPIVPGGGTFLLAHINGGEAHTPGIEAMLPNYDVQFFSGLPSQPNPWNEPTATSSGAGVPIPINGNRQNGFILFKVLNDSIKFGLKPIQNPDDFEVLDVWGMPNRGYWVIGGVALNINSSGQLFIRKPHINKGNPEWAGSFGTNPDDCEWTMIYPNVTYSHLSSTEQRREVYASFNDHFMIEPTFFKSTVNSSVYKVSPSYGPNEKIEGLKTGTTLAEFLSFINKEDEGQTLKVLAAADGSELGMDAVIGMNDVLKVLSADSVNTTMYRLDVGDGLSSNAVLTSATYTIDIESAPKSANKVAEDGVASISGFDYGTNLKTIVDKITVPAGARLTIIDGSGSYVPFKLLNFDTTYVNVTVNPDIYFDVVAEDNLTRIVYQLQPATSDEDAFILSDVYSVSQGDKLIDFVPRGTNFQAFLANITPSLGASLKLVDKMGFERTQGSIREDDKVVVTSPNGLMTNVYFISFLPTLTIPSTTYLAYVLSDSYAVDQVSYVIAGGTWGVNETTTVAEFYSNIYPALGATVVVIDSQGNEKTAGNLAQGDLLKVTSMDGRITATYQIGVTLTSTEHLTLTNIEIYPNPTSDKLNIHGLEAGNRIRIFSATGALLRDVKAQSSLEVLSLDGVPSGMFLIVISNKDKMLGRYKAIRK